MKVYSYKGCGTCRKALKYLDERRLDYKILPIREQPPTLPELQRMLKLCGGNLKRLFNTSGLDYKALKIKDKLPKMSAKEALVMLSRNGNLVKRPFILCSKGGVVGFKPEEWARLF